LALLYPHTVQGIVICRAQCRSGPQSLVCTSELHTRQKVKPSFKNITERAFEGVSIVLHSLRIFLPVVVLVHPA